MDSHPIYRYPRKVRRDLVTAWYAGPPSPALRETIRRSEEAIWPGWYESMLDERWLDNADQLGRFLRKHGRFPNADSDAKPKERVLNSWYRSQRSNIAHLTVGKVEYLDIVAPGWNTDPVNHPRSWHHTAWEFISWRETYGMEPRIRSTDPTEHHLANWHAQQKAFARRHMELTTYAEQHGTKWMRSDYDASRKEFLDEHAPGWCPPLKFDRAKWDEWADKIRAFDVPTNGLPSVVSTPYEYSLRKWIDDQAWRAHGGTGYLTWTDELAAIMNDIAPGWDSHYADW